MADYLTDDELREMLAESEARSPFPWRTEGYDRDRVVDAAGDPVADCQTGADGTIIAAAPTLAAEVLRLRELNQRLYDSLQHMRACRSCAEGDWSDCDGGDKALSLLTEARREGA